MIGAHEKSRVGGLGEVEGSVVVNGIGQVLRVLEKFLQFGDILPCLGQVEGPEVLVEGIVFQILHKLMRTLSILK